MKDRQYKAIIELDEDGYYVAFVPSIPGCHSQGDTFEEAVSNIQESLDLCLEEAANNPDYKASISDGDSKVFSIVELAVNSA